MRAIQFIPSLLTEYRGLSLAIISIIGSLSCFWFAYFRPLLQPNQQNNYASMSFDSSHTLLDSLIPGHAVAHQYLLEKFGLDTTIFVPIVLVAWLCLTIAPKVYGTVVSLRENYFTSEITVSSTDHIYDQMMAFIAHLPAISFSRNLEATTQYLDDDEYHELITQLTRTCEKTPIDFATLQLKIPPRFLPNYGSQYVWFNNRWFKMVRTRDMTSIASTRPAPQVSEPTQTLAIICFGRSTAPIKGFIQAARHHGTTGTQTTKVKKPQPKMKRHWGSGWAPTRSRTIRPMETVILREGQKDHIISDIEDFLDPLTERWYRTNGIPYHRGFLFHGPPGTGKSSFAIALAGKFSMELCIISLSATDLTEDELALLFLHLPPRAIVLLEDIDKSGPSRDGPDSSKGVGLNLGSILNILDGADSHEGHIVILTTNCLESLDDALTRPGRIDVRLQFTLADQAQVKELFQRMYTHEGEKLKQIHAEKALSEMAHSFARAIPNEQFSIAQVQGFLLPRKDEPKMALNEVHDWVVKEQGSRKCLDLKVT